MAPIACERVTSQTIRSAPEPRSSGVDAVRALQGPPSLCSSRRSDSRPFLYPQVGGPWHGAPLPRDATPRGHGAQ